MTKRKFIEETLDAMDWYICGQIGASHLVEGLANRLAEYDRAVIAEHEAEKKAQHEREVENERRV